MESAGLDAIVVTTNVNIRYYSGFTGSNGILLVLPSRSILFTDPRYQSQAPMELAGDQDCQVRVAKGSIFKALLQTLSKVKAVGKAKIGLESSRVNYVTGKAVSEGAEVVDIGADIDGQRQIKSVWEIEQIRASVQLNSAALDRAMKRFRVGMKEKDLAAEIDYQQRKLGAEGTAFETIVASGAHAALPHAKPRDAKIEAGGLLLIDMGACRNGYMSDMTRTFGVGQMPKKAREMYEAVLEAQMAALAALKAGAKVKAVHMAAVGVLEKFGMAKLFMHSTGHGLGLEIHEGPRLGKAGKGKLSAGMTVTVEPGVYEPGFGGVRIEDTVLVTENGSEILTPSPKGWTIVNSA
jgi:Xaa-Pro aminopeptidase